MIVKKIQQVCKELWIKAIPLFERVKEFLNSSCQFVKEMYGKIRNLKRSAKMCGFLALSMLAIVYSFAMTDVSLAYKVDFEGNFIATVKDKAQFENAVCMVEEKVQGVSLKNSVNNVKYTVAVVRNDLINNDVEVADAIMESTEDIVLASALYIDGIEYSRVRELDVKAYLEEYKNRFLIEGVQSEVGFLSKVEIKQDYYAANSIDDVEIFTQIVEDNLPVVTTAVKSEEYSIPFATVTQKTSSKASSYRKVEVAGVNGVGTKQIKDTYINGIYDSSQILEDVVVTAPVDRVVTVGTGRVSASASEISYAGSQGFIFPLPKGSWKVSAYWGDGRGHKALDLAAKSGTSIFAVKEGTVTYAGWRGGYGYMVEINHGNGLVTRYAHASKLCVSRGETVSAGTVIALVGSTGNSTGNHLHFEVARNGSNCNPAPYIGL